MRFLHSRDEFLELSLDDVFLVPSYYEGSSRLSVDLSPLDFVGSSHPIVSANMNAVTGKRMAEVMARYGGLGILPQDMDIHTVSRIINHIKNAPLNCDTGVSVGLEATVRDVRGLIRKRNHNLVVVCGDDGIPVGVLTYGDIEGKDQYTLVRNLVTSSPFVLSGDFDFGFAHQTLLDNRVHAAPVLDSDSRLVGVLTRDDAVRFDIMEPSVDSENRLMVGAALGVNGDVVSKARAYLDLGVDVLVLDTAHGDQRKVLEVAQALRYFYDGPLVAGNVCTVDGVRRLVDVGVDIIKVNVGPGAMCTTRMKTGVGRPSFSAVRVCAQEASKYDCHVWADGGVRHPRDVALYLAAGASRVMVGSCLAGTYESPADIKGIEGSFYKENYGMASSRAVRDRNGGLDAFRLAKRHLFREGISTSRIPLVGGVGDVIFEMLTGVMSSVTYMGAENLHDFQEKAVVGVQTQGGFYEGTPHGKG